MLDFIILEDEKIIRKSILRIIDKSLPIKCVGEFHDGREAVEFIESHDVSIDIVLTDSLMPMMDGIEFSKWIMHRYPDVLVIFFSGHSEYDLMRSAMQTRAYDYILKPVDRKELNDTLFSAVEHIRKSSPIFSVSDEELADMLRFDSGVKIRGIRVVCLIGGEDASEDISGIIHPLIRSRKLKLYDADVSVFILESAEIPQEALDDISRAMQSFGASAGISRSDAGSIHKAFMQAFSSAVSCASSGKNTIETFPDNETFRTICSMLSHIYVHYTDKQLGLVEIADRSGYTYSYASRLLGTVLGMSCTDWILKLRLAKAKRLLSGSDARISDIAEACGFSSASYFNKVFKKEESLTPQEFRMLYSLQNAIL